MLRVDLRDVQRGPVETRAEVPPDDPLFEGLDFALSEPLEVEGRLQAMSHGEYLWRGHIRGTAEGSCRRCLTGVTHPFESDAAVLFSSEPDAADNPEVVALAPTASQIDLSDAVREEVVLAVPPFLLCREECAGLCPQCGADLNAGPCGCTPAEPV